MKRDIEFENQIIINTVRYIDQCWPQTKKYNYYHMWVDDGYAPYGLIGDEFEAYTENLGSKEGTEASIYVYDSIWDKVRF